MSPDVHRIRRQRWVVRAGSPADAFAIRQYLRERSPELIEPVLQAAFDAAADAGTVLHLPKVELHVRVTSLEEMATALPALVARQLREQLPPHRATVAAPDAEAAWTTSTTPEARWEQLLHYLNTGLLRWESAGVPPFDCAERLRETCREQEARLHRWLATDPVSVDFFLRLMPLIGVDGMAGCTALVASRLGAEGSSAVEALIRHLLEPSTTGPAAHVRSRLAALVLQDCHGTAGGGAPPDIVARFARVLEPRELMEFVALCPSPVREWIRRRDDEWDQAAAKGTGTAAGEAGSKSSPLPKDEEPGAGAASASAEGVPAADREASPPLKRADAGAGVAPEGEAEWQRAFADFKANLPPGFPVPARAVDGPGREPAIPAGGPRPADGTARGAIAPEPANLPGRQSVTARERGAGGAAHPDLVSHAGLILLHPFVPRLFENLHVKDRERSELRPDGVERAGAILHWLATGRAEVFEFELGFIKVLLGLTPRTPLHVSASLVTAEDREETESLLRSVIEHWTVLRGTSPNGLRAAFLEREGLLTDGGDHWKLRVERRGFDVLVDSLPWSISMIKLPWAAKPVFATW